jgi:predicted P-loop ATPase
MSYIHLSEVRGGQARSSLYRFARSIKLPSTSPVDALTADRSQLWTEAVAAFRTGES